jgi:hypothetical protein
MANPTDLRSIIDLINNDPRILDLLDGPMDNILPDSWGLAGSARNIGYIFQGLDSSDPEVAARICVGISNSTAKVVQEQIKLKNPAFSNITGTSTVDRERDVPIIGKVSHTATVISTKDGETYVLDYHHTLNPENPMVYPSIEDWKNETNGQTAEEFFNNNPVFPKENLVPSENGQSGSGNNSELIFSDLLAKIYDNITKLNQNIS